jgi:hypothetical protein
MGTGENSGPGGPGPVGLHGVSAELQKTLGLAKANLPSRPVRAFACSALHGDGCVASCPHWPFGTPRTVCNRAMEVNRG